MQLPTVIATGLMGLALVAASAGPAATQESKPERRVVGTQGQTLRIGTFASVRKDCKPGVLPTVKLKRPPANGQVAVRQGRVRATNLKECLAVEVPAFLVLYKSSSDFVGEEQIELEVIDATGKTQTHAIRVVIEQGPPSKPGARRPGINEPI